MISLSNRSSRRKRLLIGLTVLGLALLVLVNLFPIGLVVRQALIPETAPVTWPLQLVPDQLGLDNLTSLWRAQALVEHIGLSAWVALATMFVSLALGFPAGWAAARSRFFESISTKVSVVSRILPPIAIALPLTVLLIPMQIHNHPAGIGLIVAHLTIGLPIAILVSYAAFRGVPRELEDAAHVDGCSTLGAFFRIALPAARGAIGSASIIIFLLSWDEFTYALIIQLTNRTLPPLIYYYTEFGQLGSASTLALFMLLPAGLVIVTLQRLVVRGVLVGGLKQ